MPEDNALHDKPRSLKDEHEIAKRRQMLRQKHVAPLTAYVLALRRETKKGNRIPFFDPFDGGIEAQCLFVLENPGAKAYGTGFISRNNPDQTAENTFKLLRDAGLNRDLTALWNIVPWYSGTGKEMKQATTKEIKEGCQHLVNVIIKFRRLQMVVLVGRKAQKAKSILKQEFPRLELLEMLHPSNMCLNREKARRDQVKNVLKHVKRRIVNAS
jgi:uracil-DNA glycosylase